MIPAGNVDEERGRDANLFIVIVCLDMAFVQKTRQDASQISGEDINDN